MRTIRLCDFRVKNYKSFRNAKIEDLSSLTVLIGANGSGKTNLLEAMHLFFSQFTSNSGVSIPLSEDHWHRSAVDKPIQFDVVLSLSRSELKQVLGSFVDETDLDRTQDKAKNLSVSVSIEKGGVWSIRNLRVLDTSLIRKGKSVKSDDLKRNPDSPLPLSIVQLIHSVGEGITGPRLYGIPSGSKSIFLLSDYISALIKQGNLDVDATYESTIQDFSSREGLSFMNRSITLQDLGFPTIEEILTSINNLVRNSLVIVSPPTTLSVSYQRGSALDENQVREVISLYESTEAAKFELWDEFKDAFTSEFDGELDPIRGGMFVVENRRRFPLQNIGRGFLSWFSLLKHFLEGSRIYIIEEPEAHLHPGFVQRLLGFLKKQSEKSQIILATHSPILVDRSDVGNNWVVEKRRGESRIYRSDDLIQILDSVGASLSDRMMSDRVLLVEGVSDRAFVAGCAEKLGTRMERLKIVPIRGKGNLRTSLDAWNSIAEGTQIQLLIMVDQDARDDVLRLVRRGIVEEKDYVLLKYEIEDLYPVDILHDVLVSLYKVEPEKLALAPSPRRDYIEGLLAGSDVDLKKWKLQVAQKVAANISKKDIPKDVRTILNRMK